MLKSITTASLLATAGFAAQATVVTYSDFSDTSNIQINGNAMVANNGSQDVLRLTSALNQSGTAFIEDTISLLNDASFSARFAFQITQNMGATDTDGIVGADGITFILQTTSNTAGGLGLGMGYQGLTNSIAVEFDTWNNAAIDENDGNHVGIDVNGSVDSVIQASYAEAFNNGSIWYSWVDYNGATDELEVRFADSDTRPDSAYLAYSLDLASTFGTSDVFVGFGSGTGIAGGFHDILSLSFADDYSPIDTQPPVVNAAEPFSLTMMLTGLAGLILYRRRN